MAQDGTFLSADAVPILQLSISKRLKLKMTHFTQYNNILPLFAVRNDGDDAGMTGITKIPLQRTEAMRRYPERQLVSGFKSWVTMQLHVEQDKLCKIQD